MEHGKKNAKKKEEHEAQLLASKLQPPRLTMMDRGVMQLQ
jgi:hypothetical protein